MIVDNGSADDSLELARRSGLPVTIIELGRNTGFACAANRGIEAAGAEAVALVNTDVVLAPDWIERMTAVLEVDPSLQRRGMQDGADSNGTGTLYDTGDFLRRDGVCEQRGRFERDDGRYDAPGEVVRACAGAAVYRRRAVSTCRRLRRATASPTSRTSIWGCGCGWRAGAARTSPRVARARRGRLERGSCRRRSNVGSSATR